MTAKQIITLRQQLGLTQRQLAEKIGSTPATVARWEIGQHIPHRLYVEKLEELRELVKTKKKK